MLDKIWKAVRTPVDVAVRSNQIAMILSRYGFGEGLAAVGLVFGQKGLSFARGKKFDGKKFDAVYGKKLAKTLAKLGPTFIKLGQILATRPDIVGEEVSDELKILFDRVPPIPFRAIQKILRAELGKDWQKAFKNIESKPLASASISQTHRATLKDGTPVILKVQKTGVADLVRVDMKLLETIVRPLHVVYPKLQLGPMFEDFREGTLREIDYRLEAGNIDRFHKNYRGIFADSEVVFPTYFKHLLTERVLALSPMQGRKVTDIKKGTTVARRVATQSLAAVLEQIFDHGFFHADPHAGNLFFLEESGRIGFIDLGLVGQLDPRDKRKFLKVLLAILNRDRNALANNLWELGVPGKHADLKKFDKEIQHLLDDVKKTGVDKVRLDQLLNRVLSISRRNELHVPNRYVLMIRSCLIIEGVAKSLDPKISVMKVATPIVAKSLMKTYNPIEMVRNWF